MSDALNDSAEFSRLLTSTLGKELAPDQIDRIIAFREEVLRENVLQNLTRLTSPRDFLEGNVLDVIHLEKSGLLELPALDLGAGMGVPGILHAVIYRPKGAKTWISSDSEGKKADFSRRMIEKFDLAGAQATSKRGEEVLDSQEIGTIVSRAVGSVTKLYGWLRTRSTWNTMILLKGPKWDEEWAEFQSTAAGKRLVVDKIYEYTAGEAQKRLKIVRLKRK
ncbi:MAG: class I SAM-dependent methyltransferase [Bdellovibrionales bacterium]|nr:class I SAM-dependent methyltransferase [Bdellovibrionales bacterium]